MQRFRWGARRKPTERPVERHQPWHLPPRRSGELWWCGGRHVKVASLPPPRVPWSLVHYKPTDSSYKRWQSPLCSTQHGQKSGACRQDHVQEKPVEEYILLHDRHSKKAWTVTKEAEAIWCWNTWVSTSHAREVLQGETRAEAHSFHDQKSLRTEVEPNDKIHNICYCEWSFLSTCKQWR